MTQGKDQSLYVDAVLFDVDGTLIDESQSYREAIRRTAEYLLCQPVSRDEVEEIKRLPGFNNDWAATWAVVGRRLHGHIAAPSEADRGSHAFRRLRTVFQTYYLGHQVWAELSGEEPPFEWPEPLMMTETPLITQETLQGLRQFKLGIATSRPRVEALMALRQHGLDRYFAPEVVIAAEDAAREKPDPAPLRELVRRIGCSHPVYVGDTINDALAAIGAGMPFILIGGAGLGDTIPEEKLRYRVDDVNGILELCALATTAVT